MLNQHAVCALSTQKIWAHLGTPQFILGHMMFPVPEVRISVSNREARKLQAAPSANFQIAPETQGTTQDTSQTHGDSQFLFSGVACVGGTCSMKVEIAVSAVDGKILKCIDFTTAVSFVV